MVVLAKSEARGVHFWEGGSKPVVQAQNNGGASMVVNGCTRDVDEINGCGIGVRVLASHPMKA